MTFEIDKLPSSIQAAHRQVLRRLRRLRGPGLRWADAAAAAAVQGRLSGLPDLQQRVHEQGVHGQAALHAAPLLQAGRQSNRNFFGLSYSLKNHLSFGLRFPTLIKSSKIGSLDISQNQNGISSRFTSQNSSQKFLLNCHSALRRLPRHPEVPRRRPPGGAIQGAGIEGQV